MKTSPDSRRDDRARTIPDVRAAARAGLFWMALGCPAIASAGGPAPAAAPATLPPAIAAERDALIARRCAQESLPAGRAACISVLADETLLATETRLARLRADPSAAGASARALAAFGRALNRAQRDWRRAMEADCKRTGRGGPDRRIARQTCRLGQALARDARVTDTIASAFARAGLSAPGSAPFDCALVLRLLPRRGGAAGEETRAGPLLDCDLADLIPPTPGIDLR